MPARGSQPARDTCAAASPRPPVLANPHPFTHNSANFGLGDGCRFFKAGYFQVGLLLLLLPTVLGVSIGPAAGQGYTPEQEQACTGDAFRLCSAEIPDVGRVTACMVAEEGPVRRPAACTSGRFPSPSEAATG